jgi:hypothetical protein
VTVFRLVQLEKALSPIEVMLSGIVYEVNPDEANDLSTPSITRHLLSSEAYLP